MSYRVYVSNVPYSASAEDLRAFIGKVGTVTEVIVPSDKETGRPRGFAFVCTETEHERDLIVASLNRAMFQGRTLYAEPARPRERSQ